MKRDQPSLMRLLLFRAGRLDGNEAAAIRAALESSPRLRDCWDQIESAGKTPSGSRPHASAELVAAWLDGRLGPEGTRGFEDRCWRYPVLLREAIELFEASQGDSRVNGVAHAAGDLAATTRRLESLFDRVSRGPPEATAAATDRRLADDDGSVSVKAMPRRSVQPENRTRRPSSAKMLAIAAAVLLAVSGFWLLRGFFWTAPDRQADARADAVTVSGAGSDNDVAGPDDPDRDGRAGITAAETRSPGIHSGDQATDHNNAVADLSPSAIPAVDDSGSIEAASIPPTIVDSELVNQSPPSQPDSPANVLPAPTWRQLDGVVAVRDAAGGAWTGAVVGREASSSWMIHVFPESRAHFSVGEFGTIAVDSGTTVELSPALHQGENAATTVPAHAMAMRLKLGQGAVGLLSPPNSSQIELVLDDAVVLITVRKDQTEAAVDWRGAFPVIAVRRGALDVMGISIGNGQAMTLTETRPVGNLAGPGQLDWLDGPAPRTDLSRSLRERLLASRDVGRDLNKLAGDGPRRQRNLAAVWLATVDPEGQLGTALAHPDARVRDEAVGWLLSLPLDNRSTARVWRALSASQGEPPGMRQLMALARANRAGEPFPADQLAPVLEALSSDSLLIRQLGAVLLAQRFGNPAGYQPDADPVARRAAIQIWTTSIRQQLSGNRSGRQ